MAPGFDYLVVGAGFAGSVLAERLAAGRGAKVLVVDKRHHVGGNAFDTFDDAGILIHPYGPHIFHTNSRRVFDYLSRFTAWRPYEHRVRARVDGQLVPIPINLDTVNQLYGLSLNSFEVARFFAERAEKVGEVRTSEDVVVSKVGRELFEKFFRGYTRKQWGLEPSDLDASVAARVPTRTNRDDRYFTDRYQVMPRHGYSRLFQKMLGHPNISVMLQTDYRAVIDVIPHRHLIFTGPIDLFFEHQLGPLPYRSLRFHHELHDQEWVQPVGTVNLPNDTPFTRVTEVKHLTGQRHPKSVLTLEEPQAEGEPYYPVPRPENRALYDEYSRLAAERRDVTFVGRLASYQYYNMDQVVAQALKVSQTLPEL